MRVHIIGNYEPDRQRSMLAFADMLSTGLQDRGVDVSRSAPRPKVASRQRVTTSGLAKWLAYIDKFIWFPIELARMKKNAAGQSVIFHVIDHSNAMYVRPLKGSPTVVTCHDMLAVRGGLGDAAAHCPASRAGRLLQSQILSSLKAAPWIASVSETTRGDLRRLTGRLQDPRLTVVPNALNADFNPMSAQATADIFATVGAVGSELRARPYLLIVGSELDRKNRETALRMMAHLKDRWPGILVIAGRPLTERQNQLAVDLHIRDRVLEIIDPSHRVLNALYSQARALIFPSLAEGFGWPLIEAQACDCPVVCSDLTSVPEVAGIGAIVVGAEDSTAFAEAVLHLESTPHKRSALVTNGRKNLERFTMEEMIDGYLDLYQRALEKAV